MMVDVVVEVVPIGEVAGIHLEPGLDRVDVGVVESRQHPGTVQVHDLGRRHQTDELGVQAESDDDSVAYGDRVDTGTPRPVAVDEGVREQQLRHQVMRCEW